jgi:hypothetical protein
MTALLNPIRPRCSSQWLRQNDRQAQELRILTPRRCPRQRGSARRSRTCSNVDGAHRTAARAARRAAPRHDLHRRNAGRAEPLGESTAAVSKPIIRAQTEIAGAVERDRPTLRRMGAERRLDLEASGVFPALHALELDVDLVFQASRATPPHETWPKLQ